MKKKKTTKAPKKKSIAKRIATARARTPKAPKVKNRIHWTSAEDELIQKLREKGTTWAEVGKQVSALGVSSRSGATCLQRTIYLNKTRKKGVIALRSLPSEGLSVTIMFKDMGGDVTLQTRRTLKEILAFFRAAKPQ